MGKFMKEICQLKEGNQTNVFDYGFIKFLSLAELGNREECRGVVRLGSDQKIEYLDYCDLRLTERERSLIKLYNPANQVVISKIHVASGYGFRVTEIYSKDDDLAQTKMVRLVELPVKKRQPAKGFARGF